MATDITDIITSLTLIMNEETARLNADNRDGDLRDLGELVEVKLRLTGLLEQSMAKLNRSHADWADTLSEEQRNRLADALVALGKASTANTALLERQLELSSEMMDAFAQEARRLAGKRASTYGAAGEISPLDLATPISINSHY